MTAEQLGSALSQLRAALAGVRLPLVVPGASEQRQEAAAIVTQLDDYVLPRLTHLDAPLLAVVGGSTGAGKSTLVNSLLGRPVSPSGVIRPTTRSPVLVHNPDDGLWFDSERILPSLARTKAPSSGANALQLVPEPALPEGLALLDAPDIDSLVEENRTMAAQLLDAADLWLFVTSAARYADAVPWDYLTSASRRGAAVAVVCDRIPPAAMQEVPSDLARLMTARGLADSPLFAVPETVTDSRGMLPEAAVSPIRSYLATLAADRRHREQIVLQTLSGAIAAICRRAPGVAEAVQVQGQAAAQLETDATQSFQEASRAVKVQSSDGTLLRGEVLLRWHDYVGTSEFSRVIDEKVSWVRDRLVRALKGEPPQGTNAAIAAESGLEALVIEQGEAAAERAALAWRGSPAGRILVDEHPELARTSDDFSAQVSEAIRDWQGDVLTLVGEQGKGRRRAARLTAAGVNGVGAAVMIVIFAHTAGLSGAEIGVAGGTTVVAQRLLEAIFGDEAVRRLAETAKQRLDERVEALMSIQLVRFTQVLSDTGLNATAAEDIDQAVQAVVAARHGREGEHLDTATGRAASLPAVTPSPALETGGQANTVQVTQMPEGDQAEIYDAELVGDDDRPGVTNPDRHREDGR
ncbi:dynamin family protein [Propionibacterium sp.]|uniref:dynamin family protein n=1 Tax=Propionibacterium sp. TaxID=1977903 RepID=UPI0039E8846D